MWPWGHLAFGYVAYSLSRRASGRDPPTDLAALFCAFGTQFPDLVDKPLAWWVGVLPNGRSLTHSVFSATVIVAVVIYYAHRNGGLESATAFAVGYYSHLIGDAVGSSWAHLAFLFWPVLPPVQYDDGGLIEHFARVEVGPFFFVQILIVLLIWIADGTPGTGLLYRLRNRLSSGD